MKRITDEKKKIPEIPKFAITGDKMRPVLPLLETCALEVIKPVLIKAKKKSVTFHFGLQKGSITVSVPATVRKVGKGTIQARHILPFREYGGDMSTVEAIKVDRLEENDKGNIQDEHLLQFPENSNDTSSVEEEKVNRLKGYLRLKDEDSIIRLPFLKLKDPSARYYSSGLKSCTFKTTLPTKDLWCLIDRAQYATSPKPVSGNHYGYLCWSFMNDAVTVVGWNHRFMSASTLHTQIGVEWQFLMPAQIARFLKKFCGDLIKISFGRDAVMFTSRSLTDRFVRNKIVVNTSKISLQLPNIFLPIPGATIRGNKAEILTCLDKFLEYGIDEIRIMKCPPKKDTLSFNITIHGALRNGTELTRELSFEYLGNPVGFRIRASDLRACIKHAGQNITIRIDKRREYAGITDDSENYWAVIRLKSQSTGYWAGCSNIQRQASFL